MNRMFNINDCLKDMVARGASDVHFIVGYRPFYRKNGKIMPTGEEYPVLSESIIVDAIQKILPVQASSNVFLNKAERACDFDFSYEIAGVSRFRVNVCSRMYRRGMVIRIIPLEPMGLDDLHLPPVVSKLSEYNNGLILVTGPTGCGKSTTLAALIEKINQNTQKHIIMIEDPVEFVFTCKKSIISQRQVEIDTENFSTGVKYALRQDPDIILIGEIRDVETLDAAIKASETGHLVFSTLHTNNAIETIGRMVNLYSAEQRPFLKQRLASVLRATIAQKLVPTIDEKSRRVACELLIVTSTVADLIIKDKLEDIYALVRTGSFNQMITMNNSLYQLYKAGIISANTAVEYSDNKNEIQQMLRGVYHGVSEHDVQQ